MADAAHDDPVILFDGVCNLCNRGVQFVMERDPEGEFSFAPLQSGPGAALVEECGLDPDQRETWVLVADGSCYTKSEAALRVATRLDWPYRALAPFLYVPRVLRDGVYDAVAANRYRVFGRRDECMVPTADVADRFLVDDGRPEPADDGSPERESAAEHS